MKDNAELTPLHLAILSENADAVTLLAQKGAFKVANKYGQNGIHLAARQPNQISLALMLQDATEQERNARDSFGRCPLHAAAAAGQHAAVQKLLQSGVDLNAQDAHLNTPLILAASAGFFHCVNTLVKEGADVTARNEWGETACTSPLHVEIPA